MNEEEKNKVIELVKKYGRSAAYQSYEKASKKQSSKKEDLK